jgi:arylsulfatase A-like enzyme
MDGKPNVVYVFSDQHRSEASGYAGNPDVRTPHLDRLASESICFKTAVSGLPLCCASRASLLTGQYPLTHGVFVNDVPIGQNAVSVAEAFAAGGYDTAYIGKWHVDGRGRSEFIPQERRLGFAFWRGMECTHDYNESYYYADEPVKRKWESYDAEAQTRCAQSYIKNRNKAKPFVLFLSWGPPHNPYDTAPEPYKQLYDPAKLTLRDNIPREAEELSRKELAGYYAHITALDALIGQLRATLAEENIDEDTIFVYTSDHGDMLGSQGKQRKQWPWDESILVPFLLRYPKAFGQARKDVAMPINTPDIMPTLLGLCYLRIPSTVEGTDYSGYLRGEDELHVEAALIHCIHPSGEFRRGVGGKEYRGIRTSRYTYVRDLQGPWLLFDNEKDPCQLTNLCDDESSKPLQKYLNHVLDRMLGEHHDDFLAGEAYIARWGYVTDQTGTVPYKK